MQFRIGVNDPEALPAEKCELQLLNPNTKELVVYAIGSDGTIGAIRNAMKILQDESPNCKSQANFEFDGKKSGGLTISYLRFGPDKIKTMFNPETADYVACHTQSYIGKYDFLKHARRGAVFVLNAHFDDIEKELPADLKRTIAQKDIKFCVVDANKIAQSIGLGNKISLIMGTFLMAYGMNGLVEIKKATESLKALAKITYAKQPAAVIEANMKAVDIALETYEQCMYKYNKQAWLNAEDNAVAAQHYGPKVTDKELQPGQIFDKVLKRKFDQITTEEAMPFSSGRYPAGYSKYEKAGAADKVAHWNKTDCVKCNTCAVMCPHGAIRPFIEENDEFKIQVDPLDCRGCNVCAGACPKKCITMEPLHQEVEAEQRNWDRLVEDNKNPQVNLQKCSLKDLEFAEPYLLNPGSCPGCAETTITRMLTTLFGDHLVISSAVGCCLVWGHYNQFRPYQVDKNGRGPALATSAFEDNSLFGLGMYMGQETQRRNLKKYVEKHVNELDQVKPILLEWLDKYEDPAECNKLLSELTKQLPQISTPAAQYLKLNQQYLAK